MVSLLNILLEKLSVEVTSQGVIDEALLIFMLGGVVHCLVSEDYIVVPAALHLWGGNYKWKMVTHTQMKVHVDRSSKQSMCLS